MLLFPFRKSGWLLLLLLSSIFLHLRQSELNIKEDNTHKHHIKASLYVFERSTCFLRSVGVRWKSRQRHNCTEQTEPTSYSKKHPISTLRVEKQNINENGDLRLSRYFAMYESEEFSEHSLRKLELLSAVPRATLTFPSCSPNSSRTSITGCTHAEVFI